MTHAHYNLRLVPGADERRGWGQRLMAEGALPVLLYDALPHTLAAVWLDVTSPEKAWFGVVGVNDTPVGLFWFTGFTGKSAWVHFVQVRGHGQPAHIAPGCGRYVCRWAFTHGGLHSVVGLTPAPYRHALGMVQAMGFVPQFRVPGACYLERKNKYVDGVVSLLTPQLLGKR